MKLIMLIVHLQDLILGYKHHIKGGKIDDIDINDMMLRDRRVSLNRLTN